MWLILLTIILCLLVYKIVRFFSYWKEKGVPSTDVLPALITWINGLIRTKSFGDVVLEFYNEFPNARYTGKFHFNKPLLILRDPKLIKQLTVKAFDNFVDHRPMIDEKIEPLWGKNLFQLTGDRWRDMRATLSPAFTSAKMKSMFFLINECAEQFSNHFYESNQDVITLEMKDAFTRYTNDVIASTSFGIKCDSLGDRTNEFYRMGKELTNISGKKILKMLLYLVAPFMHKFCGSVIVSEPVAAFFRKLLKDSIEHREKHGVVRPDMIHLLMEAQKGRLRHDDSNVSEDKDTGFATVEESVVGKSQLKQKAELGEDDMAAQALLFFFAGFDTVSTLMHFIAYELAINPDVQETLRKEVDATYKDCNESLTYDALSKMKYMDMVVTETLRMWPSVPAIDRYCNKPYTIEPTTPDEKPVHIEKGTVIWLPIYGLQMDPNYFPNPTKFDPERFSDENKGNVEPFSYIPFGSGPRNCIGSRFALLETKAVIFYLLTKFVIDVNEKTQVPLKLSRTDFTMGSESGVWVNLKRRVS